MSIVLSSLADMNLADGPKTNATGAAKDFDS